MRMAIVVMRHGLPANHLEIENEGGVEHRHQQQRNHRCNQQASDLRVTKRLPQRAAVQKQCSWRERLKVSPEAASQPFDQALRISHGSFDALEPEQRTAVPGCLAPLHRLKIIVITGGERLSIHMRKIVPVDVLKDPAQNCLRIEMTQVLTNVFVNLFRR